jgi:hypothetical protein
MCDDRDRHRENKYRIPDPFRAGDGKRLKWCLEDEKGDGAAMKIPAEPARGAVQRSCTSRKAKTRIGRKASNQCRKSVGICIPFVSLGCREF